MARIFKTPFGAQGDTEQVPEAPQGDGSVSLTQGFGYDYEREYEDPAAKDIRREVMNGLFHDVTEAIGDIQLSGVAKWSADAAPYPAGAVVWHSSAAWMSTVGNNSSEPGTGADWSAVDLSSSIRLSESIDQVPDAETVQEALAGLGAFAGDGYQNIAVFDTAGVTNWTVPAVLQAGLRKAKVTVIGAGGSGASARGAANGELGGGGGTAGALASGVVDLTDMSSVTVTVGSGGPPVSANGNGVSGESSSFGSYMSAPGGGGGFSSNGSPGDVAIGVGGDVNTTLGVGQSGGTTSAQNPSGGAGGGPGGRGFRSYGEDAVGPGGGGAGMGQDPGGAGQSGAGADGIVIVRW